MVQIVNSATFELESFDCSKYSSDPTCTLVLTSISEADTPDTVVEEALGALEDLFPNFLPKYIEQIKETNYFKQFGDQFNRAITLREKRPGLKLLSRFCPVVLMATLGGKIVEGLYLGEDEDFIKESIHEKLSNYTDRINIEIICKKLDRKMSARQISDFYVDELFKEIKNKHLFIKLDEDKAVMTNSDLTVNIRGVPDYILNNQEDLLEE